MSISEEGSRWEHVVWGADSSSPQQEAFSVFCSPPGQASPGGHPVQAFLCWQKVPQQQSASETAWAAMKHRTSPSDKALITGVILLEIIRVVSPPDRPNIPTGGIVILTATMMSGTPLKWTILAIYAVVGMVSSQLMLCLHQDGSAQIELTALLCCAPPAEPKGEECPDGCSDPSAAPCKDDQCQDIPLTQASPQVSSAPVLELPSTVADLRLASLPGAILQAKATTSANFTHSRDHPPESRSKEFLRTVILRL